MSDAGYADESLHEAGVDGGVYVVAVVVLPACSFQDARQAMRALLGDRRIPKPHWTEMSTGQREDAVKVVAALDGLHLAAVAAPCPLRGQERARAFCLVDLVRELPAFGVRRLVLEARTERLNRRDLQVVNGARQAAGLTARQFHLDHVHGALEPLLWLSDITAGTVRHARMGQNRYRDLLADKLLDWDVSSG